MTDSDTQHSNASERTDATTAMPAGYQRRQPGIDFAEVVPDNGYLWWYLDALSDDGLQGITLIVFVGSVFSPYYASARRRGDRPAESHCAFNTILYGPASRKRWSMTERSEQRLLRTRDSYQLGPSRMEWDGERFVAQIDERCVPFPRRMRGTITLTPSCLTEHSLMLDEAGRHHWNPIAPVARVAVDFPSMRVKWSGHGYLDSNCGSEPLADGFSGWDWTRSRLDNGECAVRYEARHPMRDTRRLALRFTPDGALANDPLRDSAAMPSTTVWRVKRRMPGSEGGQKVLRTFEDTPFYARSLVETQVGEHRALGFHESLNMQRFEQRWVQTLLPFRMPRFG